MRFQFQWVMIAGLLCMARIAMAQNEPAFSGEFVSDQISIRLEKNVLGSDYAGEITRGDAKYPCKGTYDATKGFNGTFTAAGSEFPFSLELSGDDLKMKTGSANYALKRKASGPANPLGEPGPANPPVAPPVAPPVNPGPVTPVNPNPVNPQPGPAAADMSGGIGVQLDRTENGVFYIIGIDPQGPSAGKLAMDDEIMVVSGQPTTGLNYAQIASLLRGPPGSQVAVVVLRDDGTTRNVTLTRKKYELPPLPPGGPGAPQGPGGPVAPQPGGGPGLPVQPQAGGAYTHKNGEFTITPPAGWRQEAMGDQAIRFSDPTGAVYAEVIFIPKPGFQSSKEFYDRGIKPDFQQKQVQIQVEKDFPLGAEQGYGCFFMNQKGKANYFVLLMKDGNGFIYHSEGTPDGMQQNNAALNEMTKTFRVGR